MKKLNFNDDIFQSKFKEILDTDPFIITYNELIKFIFNDYEGSYKDTLYSFVTSLLNIYHKPEELDDWLYENYISCEQDDRCPADGAGFCDVHDITNLDVSWLSQFVLPKTIISKLTNLSDELKIVNISKLLYGFEDKDLEGIKIGEDYYECNLGEITYFSSNCSQYKLSWTTIVKSVKVVLKYMKLPNHLIKLIH